MIFAQTTPPANPLMTFFSNYGLLIVLAVLVVFMFWSSRRRSQRVKAEQEQKARQTVPGAEVLLQGGLYGTVVSYDPENLDQPALIELAPGVQIKVHSQAILRVVTPTDEPDDAGAPELPEPRVETAEETAERLRRQAERNGDKTED